MTSEGKDINFPNLLQANVPFLYPLKTSENLWFSDVFRGTMAWNGLTLEAKLENILY